jgi:hypothetical protein
MLPAIPKDRLLNETEWRLLGVQQSLGWEHYAIHRWAGKIQMVSKRRANGVLPFRAPFLLAACVFHVHLRFTLLCLCVPQAGASRAVVSPSIGHRSRNGCVELEAGSCGSRSGRDAIRFGRFGIRRVQEVTAPRLCVKLLSQYSEYHVPQSQRNRLPSDAGGTPYSLSLFFNEKTSPATNRQTQTTPLALRNTT